MATQRADEKRAEQDKPERPSPSLNAAIAKAGCSPWASRRLALGAGPAAVAITTANVLVGTDATSRVAQLFSEMDGEGAIVGQHRRSLVY